MRNIDKYTLAQLEHLLVAKFRPTFLALTISEDDDIIEVVMSANQFNYLSINERTISVFNEIYKYMPGLIENHLVVVQCFNGAEIERVLDDVFEEEIKRWM